MLAPSTAAKKSPEPRGHQTPSSAIVIHDPPEPNSHKKPIATPDWDSPVRDPPEPRSHKKIAQGQNAANELLEMRGREERPAVQPSPSLGFFDLCFSLPVCSL